MIRRSISLVAAALALVSAAAYGSPANAHRSRVDQWHLGFLKVAEAQRISTGKGVTVAVIDTGVADHPDLAGSVLNGADFIDRGGNGRTDSVGHGTGMAGLIAAHGQNGEGALGIAPDAKILPIRVTKNEDIELDLGEPIKFAISHGAKVINISASSGLTPQTINAVKAAADSDVLIVAAAGNKPKNLAVVAPAFIDGVLAVGSVDQSGQKSSFSVSGPSLDLVAPGRSITTTANKKDYSLRANGTSDAAAIVSGAAALLRSKYPAMTAREVADRLESTAIDKGEPGVDKDYGHGVINIVAALADSNTPTAPSASAPAPKTASAAPSNIAPAPDTEPASSSAPLILGGAVVVLLVGALAAFFLARRRSKPTP